MRELNTLCYIKEEGYPELNTNVGYKVHDKGNRFFLTFNATLQSFDVENRNKRYYEASNIMDRINNDEYIQDQLSRNCWIGELDHPAAVIVGQDLTSNRIGNPDPTRSSHFIRKPWLSGNLLKAPIQTDSSNECGMNMAIKMVDGHMVPGFSARVLGELVNRNGRPTVHVKRLVTYDSVFFPSHKEALGDVPATPVEESAKLLTDNRIVFLTELARMAANNSKETEWLCESFGVDINSVVGLTETGNSIVIKEDQNVYIQPISDKIIRQRTKNIITDYFNQGSEDKS